MRVTFLVFQLVATDREGISTGRFRVEDGERDEVNENHYFFCKVSVLVPYLSLSTLRRHITKLGFNCIIVIVNSFTPLSLFLAKVCFVFLSLPLFLFLSLSFPLSFLLHATSLSL